jgi:predicted Zn finger-like uncharacterized protein
MRFSCKKCNAKYALADEKIRGKVVKVRCKHCGQVMVVRDNRHVPASPAELVQTAIPQSPVPPSYVPLSPSPPSEPPITELPTSEAPPTELPPPELPQSLLPQTDAAQSDLAQSGVAQSDAAQSDTQRDTNLNQDFEQTFKDLYEFGQQQRREIAQDTKLADETPAEGGPVWYYGLDGTEVGPFSLLEMEERIRRGSITRDHFVWREGMDDWAPVEEALGPTVFSQQLRPENEVTAKRKIVAGWSDHQKLATNEAAIDEIKKRVRDRQETRDLLETLEQQEPASVQPIDVADYDAAAIGSLDDGKAKMEAQPTDVSASVGEKATAPAEEPRLAPSSRADWFEESQPQQKMDENRLSLVEEEPRDSIEEVVKAEQEQKPSEGQLDQTTAPFDDFLAEKIDQLREELAKDSVQPQQPEPLKDLKQPKVEDEEPVTMVSPPPELSKGEHELHQTSERFFESGETPAPPSELLPPKPVVDAEQIAAQLHAESLEEEEPDDSITPIAEAQHPASDSMIIRQAGVHSAGRRIRTTLIGVLFVILVASGVLALVVNQDWFNGSQLDSTKHDDQTPPVNGARTTMDKNTSLEDTKKIRSLLEGGNSQPSSTGVKMLADLPKPMSATTMRSVILPDNNQNVFDIGAGEEGQHAKTRVQKGDIGVVAIPDIAMTADIKVDELHGKKPEAPPLPPDRQTGPEKLSDLQVHLVIQKHYAQVKSCQQRQLQRDSSIAGKMIVVARVRPDGSVESVRVDTPRFRGSFVEECLISEIKNWLFPAFKGEAYDVPFQLQLMAREEVSGR